MIRVAVLVSLLVLACSKKTEETSTPLSKEVMILGAGATFQYPLMSKWSAEYAAKNPGVKINYQSIGSGGGIRQLIAKTVHFGSTDSPMTEAQLTEAQSEVLHIPVTLGAVAVVYNLPELKTSINFTGEVLAKIFLQQITKWNDPSITALNPGITLPDREITVVHRSDGSGTTAIFTDFLSKISDEWKSRIGSATSVSWPGGIGAKGNEGVTGQVRQTPGSIGYVELTYALQNNLVTAAIQNLNGKFVAPTTSAVSAAAAGAVIPDDMRVSITNAGGENSYPISGFSWVIIYKNQTNCEIATPLLRFLWWGIHDGQKYAEPLHYAPLPLEVVTRAENMLKSVTCNGKGVL